MSRIDRFPPRHARALLVLPLLLGAIRPDAALAATVCVDTANEFIAAVRGAAEEDMTVNVVTGTYSFAIGPLAGVAPADHELTIIGGWNSNCSARQPDPRLTVFTGSTDAFGIGTDDSLRVESVAFIDIGWVWLRSHESNLSVERVWFQNVCGNEGGCTEYADDPVVFAGENVYVSQVVATGIRGYECPVRINTRFMQRGTVLFSLFTDNDGYGLCARPSEGIPGSDDPVDDFELLVQNSIFWDNAQDDILTRLSPHILLRNNIYQSTDMSPAPETTPTQTLGVNPQFQNAAGRDFRLQASSPAINSGRFGVLYPDQDLDGGARVVGQAPDRGPFESQSTESTFQVVNTFDTLNSVAPGSLRWAIEQANETPGLDRIRFALPGCPRIIELNAPLPDITDSVFIDGYSQAGSARNASARGFTPTLCIGLRDAALAIDHALRIPSGAADDTFLWVSGLAFGGFDIAAVRIAAGSNTWVFGNQFGGSLGGTALGNNAVNVRLGGTSHDNLVGGVELSQRNLIGWAYSGGVELLDNGSGAEGYRNTVRNNLIGLDSNGQDAAPNALGVRVRTSINTIEDNYISGNQGDGVLLEGVLAYSNKVLDNTIGLKTFTFCVPPCTPDYALGNGGAGVRITGGGYDHWVRYNRIAHNGGAGVRIEEEQGHHVHANAISSNGGLGVDLGPAGVNPVYNSGLAITATYANRGLNAPTLLTAGGSGRGGRVTGQIASRNGTHRVQVFRNAACDASGRGEGADLLLIDQVTVGNAPIGGNGTASFDFELPSDVSFEGMMLTALLVDGELNTSEFSACLAYETVQCREVFRDGLEDNPPPAVCTPL